MRTIIIVLCLGLGACSGRPVDWGAISRGVGGLGDSVGTLGYDTVYTPGGSQIWRPINTFDPAECARFNVC